MPAVYKFQGWLGNDTSSVNGQMVWGEFQPKEWEEHDVDIEVSCCGMCGTDVHTLSSGWEPTLYRTYGTNLQCCPFVSILTTKIACVVGHEIVGTAVRVGKQVKNIKVGDRVGVGAQAGSCLQSSCEACSNGQEAYCSGIGSVNTYGSLYPNNIGISYGGYSTYHRTHSHFVFKIPEGLDSENAAPMLCGGVTVYAPLKDNGCGPGKKVGIVGIGGLGHFALLFSKALGADEVVGISRKAVKREDVLKLGADRYIATDDDNDWASDNAHSLDLIISTVSNADFPLKDYLELLRVKGSFIQVG
jgi:D-arabinose 1-dehydrogenase-like Zn-dependent alcohol dehydrogenase